MNAVRLEIAASTERSTKERSTFQPVPVNWMILSGESNIKKSFGGQCFSIIITSRRVIIE